MQYAQVRAIEHLHPLVRSRRELERVLKDVEASPGIVLYTIFNRELAEELEQSCKRLNIPCVAGAADRSCRCSNPISARRRRRRSAGQHVLDADYFRRIEALNFTMLHDDGHLPENLDDADIVLVGISRTSKTPTIDLSRQSRLQDRQCAAGSGHGRCRRQLEAPTKAFVVGLVASAERIAQVRQTA